MAYKVGDRIIFCGHRHVRLFRGVIDSVAESGKWYMILIDDPTRSVIEPLLAKRESFDKAYDVELMLGGGHLVGYNVDPNEEANILSRSETATAPEAAQALLTRGAGRVLVTNGGELAAEGRRDEGVIMGQPPKVLVTRVTGAGDTFMAAHLVAERRGATRQEALDEALRAAATYVSGDIGS